MNPWIQTYTGKRFDLVMPVREMVDIRDIAHGLSNVCRFAGQSEKFYSVAQHSVHVSRVLPPEFALDGLLHDAAEAYVGDTTSPLRRLPELAGFNEIHDRVFRAICDRFGNKWPVPPEVLEVDLRMLATEAQPENGLVGPRPGWSAWGVKAQPYILGAIQFGIMDPWIPEEAEHEFLERYNELVPPIGG